VVLFAERGYDATSVRAITSRAGANVAAVKYYFGGKQQLFMEAISVSYRNTALAQPPALDRDPRTALRQWFRWGLRTAARARVSDDAYAALLMRVAAEQSSDPAVLALAERMSAPMLAMVTSWVTRMAPDAPIERRRLAAQFITSLGRRVAEQPSEFDAIGTGEAMSNPDDLADALWRFALGGLERLLEIES